MPYFQFRQSQNLGTGIEFFAKNRHFENYSMPLYILGTILKHPAVQTRREPPAPEFGVGVVLYHEVYSF